MSILKEFSNYWNSSNSFHQELSNNEEVKEFCLVNYETKFIISEIISVIENAHPIYSWMTSEYNETPNGIL